MKRILLCLILAIPGYALYAQAPVIVAGPSNGLACAGSSSIETYATYSNAATNVLWEESTDGAASWHAVTASSLYTIFYNSNFAPGLLRTYLRINSTLVSMNNWLYRVTLTNASGSSGISSDAILQIAQTAPSAISFLNPKLSVCVGETVPYALTGMLNGEDSIYWNYTGAISSVYAASAFADTTILINFTSTGTSMLSAYVFNGCGGVTVNPISINVNPLQNTLAATPGGGPVCTDYSVFSGATTSFSDATCSPVAVVTSSGSHPLGGSVQSCVTVDASV